MKILFIHPNIPGQYKHLVQRYAADPANTVVFICKPKAEVNIPGVYKAEYKPRREPQPSTHRYLIGSERAVLQGQEVWRVCKKLKLEEGFIPDIICTHPGWGDGLYLKDIYPEVPVLAYFEFFYHFTGADVNFDPELPVTLDDAARIRTKNIVNLMNLDSADWGITPTHWQKSVHPRVYQPQISVLHEGVDTSAVVPDDNVVLKVGKDNRVLKKGDPIITYVARNFEHYRGFHHFMRAAKLILDARPDVNIIAVGADDVSYGRQAPKGTTFRKLMLAETKPDMNRLHFVGQVPYEAFLKVLQISSAHIYLTVPFVLSWSMLESMSAECLVLGSDTAPVREVIEDGRNGVLVDFFSPEDIAKKALDALARPKDYAPLRKAARQTIVDRFDLQKLLPLHEKLIAQIAAKQFPPQVQREIDSLYDSGLERRMAS